MRRLDGEKLMESDLQRPDWYDLGEGCRYVGHQGIISARFLVFKSFSPKVSSKKWNKVKGFPV